MTGDMLTGYVEEMPAIRAERLLDAASAAHPSKTWLDGLVQVLQKASASATSAGGRFIVNGQRVGVAGLRRFFGQMKMPGGGTFTTERGA